MSSQFNRRQQEVQDSYTKAKSSKFISMINGLISQAEYDKWVAMNSVELNNALEYLASKPANQLDVWAA